MSIESVMPSSHLILCRPFLLLPPIPPIPGYYTINKWLCLRVFAVCWVNSQLNSDVAYIFVVDTLNEHMFHLWSSVNSICHLTEQIHNATGLTGQATRNKHRNRPAGFGHWKAFFKKYSSMMITKPNFINLRKWMELRASRYCMKTTHIRTYN